MAPVGIYYAAYGFDAVTILKFKPPKTEQNYQMIIFFRIYAASDFYAGFYKNGFQGNKLVITWQFVPQAVYWPLIFVVDR